MRSRAKMDHEDRGKPLTGNLSRLLAVDHHDT